MVLLFVVSRGSITIHGRGAASELPKMWPKILPNTLSLFLKHSGIQCMYNCIKWQTVALVLVPGAHQELGGGFGSLSDASRARSTKSIAKHVTNVCCCYLPISCGPVNLFYRQINPAKFQQKSTLLCVVCQITSIRIVVKDQQIYQRHSSSRGPMLFFSFKSQPMTNSNSFSFPIYSPLQNQSCHVTDTCPIY